MKISALDINNVIRNLDVKSTIEEIIADRIAEMYSSQINEYGYDHLISEYFNSIFIADLDRSFVPLISKSDQVNINMFFIRCGFLVKTSKAYNHPVFVNMWFSINSLVNQRLNNLFVEKPDNALHNAFNNFIVDFEAKSNQISDYFINLQKQYEEGAYAEKEVSTAVAVAIPPKLKTTLTVPQLVLLFKSLNELKAPLFDIVYQEELVQFIVSNFETKGASTLKEDSVRNTFSEFNQDARDFWLKHISTMQKNLTNLKEK
jgi:hypothetical protein